MAVVKLSTAGLTNYAKYSSMLAGNDPFVAGAYDLLETTTLTSSASSVTFSGLGSYSNYAHLQLRMVIRGGSSDNFSYTLNGDTSSIYALHRIRGNGSSVTAYASTSASSAGGYEMPTSGYVSGAFGAIVMDILDFSSTSKNTTVRGLYGHAADGNRVGLVSNLYASTDAITSFTTDGGGGGFGSGCRFSLYGIKGA